MVIDAHCHLIVHDKELSAPSVKFWAELFAGALNKIGRPATPEGIDFTGEEVAALLGGNAEALFARHSIT